MAMSKPEFLKHSCYKFMFLLGIIDMIMLQFNCFVFGIQSVIGIYFCDSVTFFYFIGVVTNSKSDLKIFYTPLFIGLYCGGNTTCILLALNRMFEMCLPDFAKILYSGRRVYFWLAVPIVEIFYVNLFQVPGFYIPKMHAGFYDPFNLVDDLSNPTPVKLNF